MEFLSGEEAEDITAVDIEFLDYKKQKREARARMAAMQALPYEIKKKRSEIGRAHV